RPTTTRRRSSCVIRKPSSRAIQAIRVNPTQVRGNDKSQTGVMRSKKKQRRNDMAYETIVAVFDTRAHADAAVKALRAGGFANADISIFDEERLAAGKKAIATRAKNAGLWHRLFGPDIPPH